MPAWSSPAIRIRSARTTRRREFARGFEITRALGAKVLTTTTNPSLVPKLSPLAEKYKIKVGLHNHSRIREDEFATPDDFLNAIKNASPLVGINLDAGHFFAAGFDPVEFTQTSTTSASTASI